MDLTKEQTEELQKTELEILKAFIFVCEKLQLRYFLIGGTLLGAVRHKGFIPWDDDIDVCMLREDYDIFLEKAQEYLPENLFLQTYKTDEGYHQVFAKIRKSDTAFIESSVKSLNINHGVFIDIFPLDFHSDEKNKMIFKIKNILLNLRTSYAFEESFVSTKVKIVRVISKIIYPNFQKALEAKENLHRFCKSGDKLASYSGLSGEKDIFPAEWAAEDVEMVFEGLKVNCPSGYDEWLTQLYGDYMQLPPVEKRVTHHITEVIDTEHSYLDYINR